MSDGTLKIITTLTVTEEDGERQIDLTTEPALNQGALDQLKDRWVHRSLWGMIEPGVYTIEIISPRESWFIVNGDRLPIIEERQFDGVIGYFVSHVYRYMNNLLVIMEADLAQCQSSHFYEDVRDLFEKRIVDLGKDGRLHEIKAGEWRVEYCCPSCSVPVEDLVFEPQVIWMRPYRRHDDIIFGWHQKQCEARANQIISEIETEITLGVAAITHNTAKLWVKGVTDLKATYDFTDEQLDEKFVQLKQERDEQQQASEEEGDCDFCGGHHKKPVIIDAEDGYIPPIIAALINRGIF